jgi:L-arabinokinase
MGARILGELLSGAAPGLLGPLANVLPSAFLGVRDRVPVEMTGAAFLERYGTTADPVTRVEGERTYAVRAPTEHPIQEHFRVRAFRELLTPPLSEERLALLGELMRQSHASYSACGLGSPGTDRLVELAREAGPGRGFYGAKITGGGSGGTVAVLARRGADLEPLLEAYGRESGHRPYVFRGSSPGAADFGLLKLRPR